LILTDSIQKRNSRLGVSVINYRTAQLTIQCIASVLADFGDTDGHICVVDNNSGDGSAKEIADWIAAQKPVVPVTLVYSATNTGFSGGHNQGIGAHQADYYLVLNSDAILRPGFCRAILDAADSAPQCGLFAPRIEYDDGKQQVNCFRLPSPASELIRGAATGPITRMLQAYDTSLAMPPAPGAIGWASFACILLRHEMLTGVGLMDEGYFLYFEDTEYCLRAARAGWKIAHVPEARVVHFRGGSGPVKELAGARKRLPAYFYASRARLFYQAYGRVGLIAANILWMLGRLIANLRRFIGKPVPKANQAELCDIWINTLTPLGNRYDAEHYDIGEK